VTFAVALIHPVTAAELATLGTMCGARRVKSSEYVTVFAPAKGPYRPVVAPMVPTLIKGIFRVSKLKFIFVAFDVKPAETMLGAYKFVVTFAYRA
jgi:hypothetical protein